MIPDLKGKKFSRLTAMHVVKISGTRLNSKWSCICDCGQASVVRAANLVYGITKSCGCMKKEANVRTGRKNKTHGMSTSRTYNIWAGMRARCLNPTSQNYAAYGGRGVALHEPWLKFDGFLADMGIAPDGMSIDRIDNDGDYTPHNCRWATTKQQARNTSASRILEYDGRRLTIAEWVETTGISRAAIKGRLERNWPIDKVLTVPVQGRPERNPTKHAWTTQPA